MMNFIGTLAYVGQSLVNSVKSSTQSLDCLFDYADAQELLTSIEQIEIEQGREKCDRVAVELSQVLENHDDSSGLTELLAQIRQAQQEQNPNF